MLSLLYNQEGDVEINTVSFHNLFLCTIPYFNCIKIYENKKNINFEVSIDCIKLFKKWLYEQPISKDELNIEIGIEIKYLSDFLIINFYRHLHNELFVKILESSSEDQFKYFIYFRHYDKRFKFTIEQINTIEKDTYYYGIRVLDGLFIEKNEKEAFTIFKNNWLDKNCKYCLYIYAYCLLNGIGCEKNETEAFLLFKKGWDIFDDSKCLHSYAYCLRKGLGCEKNENEAFNLFKLNWKRNKDAHSLNSYALYLEYNRSFQLFKMNWEKNRSIDSLHNYIYLLENGLGCKQDLKSAKELKKYLI